MVISLGLFISLASYANNLLNTKPTEEINPCCFVNRALEALSNPEAVLDNFLTWGIKIGLIQ